MGESLGLILQLVTLLAIIFGIYKYFRDPDIKNQDEINVIRVTCREKHLAIDKNLNSLAESYKLIKENDLKHIEESVKTLEIGQSKIFTILEERLPKK